MMSKLLIPKPLNKGDTIGIIAPASPFDQDDFNSGISILKELSLVPVFSDEIFLKYGYHAGEDNIRAESLIAMFKNPEIKGIFCARGGYGSMKLLSYIDFEIIKNNPKILIGFSDITVLLSAIYNRVGLITYHGPVVCQLGGLDKKSINSLLSLFSSDNYIIRPHKPDIIIPGIAKGPVIGGNLTSLCHLVGTTFQPVFNEHILFLEDRGESLYRIDRMLTQMKMAGCFEGILGLVLGSFSECGDIDKIIKLFKTIFYDYDIPFMAGFEFGHGSQNVVIPIGMEAVLDCEQGIEYIHKY